MAGGGFNRETIAITKQAPFKPTNACFLIGTGRPHHLRYIDAASNRKVAAHTVQRTPEDQALTGFRP